jgi:hypothetical protein
MLSFGWLVGWLVATKVDMPLYDRKVSWLEMEMEMGKTALQQKLEFMQVSAKAKSRIQYSRAIL